MEDPTQTRQAPPESRPLEPVELSKEEILAILSIERRLRDVSPEPDFKEHEYLFNARDRYSRVLLLDGGRGTGKTALLLTLAKWWNEKREDRDKTNKSREQAFIHTLKDHDKPDKIDKIPDHVRVLDILDFDPLPPGMPLLAGIVQAWRRLAEHFESRLSPLAQDACDDDGGEVMDLWHQLFRMAAVGWTSVPIKEGLIEQVLDRQEQVNDWQRLGTHWHRFVDKVLKVSSRLRSEDELNTKTVFVIMIDDVDLQVERIRELLPALRMLYHPQVFFIVAADSSHMVDMLKLDFLGKENILAHHRGSGNPLPAGNKDHWATLLAKSAFEKVFPLANRYLLAQLSLKKFLLHTPDNLHYRDFQAVLNSWHQQQKLVGERDLDPLGTYLAGMTNSDEDALLQRFIPYRSVVQIYARAQELHSGRLRKPQVDDRGNTVQGAGSQDADDSSMRSAQEVIGNMIGRADAERFVRRTTQDVGGKEVLGIYYLAIGKLSAEFPEEFADEIDNGGEIVLGSQTDIVFEDSAGVKTFAATSPNKDPVLSSIIAVSLRDDHFGVIAPGLQWNIPHAIAWTNVRLSEYTGLEGNRISAEPVKYPAMTFQWRMYEHPSPLRLLQWASKWAGFVRKFAFTTGKLDDRVCYGWIYCQLHWSESPLVHVADPFQDSFHTDFADKSKRKDMWETLLSVNPATGNEKEKRWRLRTLPLLARPELGLPIEVQELLIGEFEKAVGAEESKADHYDWLREERLKLIADAIVAANPNAKDAENEGNAKNAINTFEARFRKREKKPSEWYRAIEATQIAPAENPV